MNSRARILAILLVSISFCDVNIVNASIFDRILRKVEQAGNEVASAQDKIVSVRNKARDAVASAQNKVMEVRNKARDAVSLAQNKVMEARDKAIATKDKVVTTVKDQARLAKDKLMDVKDQAIATKDRIVQEAKKGVSRLSEQVTDTMSKVGEIAQEAQRTTDQVLAIAGNVNIPGDQVTVAGIADSVAETNGQEETATTDQDDVIQDQDEQVFPEEVIAKIDKLMPSKEAIDQLKSISFDGMPITDEDIPYLIERLKKFASEGIKKILLSFRKTSISLNGAMQILEGLKSYPQFVSGLTFSGNALGDEGALSIASNLSNFPMLKYLFFSDMGISGDGAVAIISMINQMSKNDERTSIQLIDLSNNKIKDEYLKTLVQSWNETKDNEQMMLMLHDNPFKNTVSIDIPSNIKLVLK